jgi:small redox-active disulfide protein 2
MLTIKVLGAGCANCKRLEQITRKAIENLAIEAELIKITDYGEIAEYNVISTPGLVINEQLVSSGRIPSESEIISFLANTLEAE